MRSVSKSLVNTCAYLPCGKVACSMGRMSQPAHPVVCCKGLPMSLEFAPAYRTCLFATCVCSFKPWFIDCDGRLIDATRLLWNSRDVLVLRGVSRYLGLICCCGIQSPLESSLSTPSHQPPHRSALILIINDDSSTWLPTFLQVLPFFESTSL
jgi:hypothetical protein